MASKNLTAGVTEGAPKMSLQWGFFRFLWGTKGWPSG